VNGGNSVTDTYDADNLPKTVGDLSLSFDGQNGELTGSTLGSLTMTAGYNSFGEGSDLKTSAGSGTLFEEQDTRDSLGRVTQSVQTVAGQTHTFTYGYDVDGRLTSVGEDGTPLAQYSYDANGNRLSTAPGNTTPTATYDGQDRLLSEGGTTYAYSPNGYLATATSGGKTTSYTYDDLGNLTDVTLTEGTKIHYLIDGNGDRIGKEVNGTLVAGYLYDTAGRVVAELDGSGTLVERFVYAGSNTVPSYLVKGGVDYALVTDGRGSVRLVVNAQTGVVAQELDYDAWGKVTNDTSPGFQPFGFAGGLYDPQTGLVHFGARDYDATTGRWTGRDPILFNGGDTNLYGYVSDDPINVIDPSGEQGIGEAVWDKVKFGPTQLAKDLTGDAGGIGLLVERQALISMREGIWNQIDDWRKQLNDLMKRKKQGCKDPTLDAQIAALNSLISSAIALDSQLRQGIDALTQQMNDIKRQLAGPFWNPQNADPYVAPIRPLPHG
jgi:RHS repeat-associated protein